MDEVEQYEKHARDADEQAEAVSDPRVKAQWQHVAHQWRALAQHARRLKGPRRCAN